MLHEIHHLHFLISHMRRIHLLPKDLNWLEKQLRDGNFSYKKIKLNLYTTPVKSRNGTETYNDTYAIKQSDYNKLATSLQLKKLFINDNETYVLSGAAYVPLFSAFDQNYNSTHITLANNNYKLQVKGFEADNALPANFAYETLVLADSVINNSSNYTKRVTAYNYNVENWENTYAIADEFVKRVNKDRTSFEHEEMLVRVFETSNALYKIKSGSASYFLIGTFLGIIFFIGNLVVYCTSVCIQI